MPFQGGISARESTPARRGEVMEELNHRALSHLSYIHTYLPNKFHLFYFPYQSAMKPSRNTPMRNAPLSMSSI